MDVKSTAYSDDPRDSGVVRCRWSSVAAAAVAAGLFRIGARGLAGAQFALVEVAAVFAVGGEVLVPGGSQRQRNHHALTIEDMPHIIKFAR